MLHFKFIFIAYSAHVSILHVVYLIFYVTRKNNSLPYGFCSTLLAFGMGGSRTSAASKIEPFVAKVNSWKSLLLLERASSYINFICCLDALRPTLSQCLVDSLTKPILIIVIFLIIFTTHRSPGADNEVGSLSPTERLWGLT